MTSATPQMLPVNGLNLHGISRDIALAMKDSGVKMLEPDRMAHIPWTLTWLL
jgi:hypothetical protein